MCVVHFISLSHCNGVEETLMEDGLGQYHFKHLCVCVCMRM